MDGMKPDTSPLPILGGRCRAFFAGEDFMAKQNCVPIAAAFMLSLWAFFAGCQTQTDPTVEPETPILDDALVGTMWLWDAGGWGMGYLEFISESEVWDGSDANRAYAYSSGTKKGSIEGLGPFTVSDDNQAIDFAQWKSYPHGAYFERVYERPDIGE
jgi:hypothetical protein